MELLTAAQMRAIERAAIESGEVTGLELMERAGRGVVDAIFDWRPELAAAPGRAVVLCGPGNNGGDGFVVARLLKGKGWEVDVFLYGDEAKLPPDAAENARRWRAMGDVAPFSSLAKAERFDALLYVDSLFGGGLSRQLPDDLRAARPYLSPEVAERTIAVDAPSGLCLDSGRVLGFALPAGATCTFQRERRGHRLAEGPGLCGALFVKDIGLESRFAELALVEALREAPVRRAHPRTVKIAKTTLAHKYAYGHALIPAGGVGKGGAARLAARGALRVGAGLVTIGAPTEAIPENAARLDAIMLRPIDGAGGLRKALTDKRLNAVVLGPGLGVGPATRSLVEAALSGEGRGVVLDADALTSFEAAPLDLFAMTGGSHAVLTPHGGEFARLFPDIAAKLAAVPTSGPAYSKVDATREAAARAGCVVLFKGPDTVVASPDGAASVVSAHYERACPWLATAGAGDVLAGMIGGLLARGFAPKAAAETAAWLHQEAARRFGPGLIAEDLPEQLPGVFRDLGL